MNVICIVRANERYVFLYDDDPRSVLAMCLTLAQWLCDDELETFDAGMYLAAMGRVVERASK